MAAVYLAKVSCLLVAAAALFSVPLLYKFGKLRPTSRIVSDQRPLRDCSTFWCQGYKITGQPGRFRAYVLPSEDILGPLESETFEKTFRVAFRAPSRWAFFLSGGSTGTVEACGRFPGTSVSVIRGERVRECMRTLRAPPKSDEGSASSEESDEATSSISSSQGVVSNETDAILHASSCSTMGRVLAPASYRCVRRAAFNFTVQNTDLYYVLVSHQPVLELLPNAADVRLSLWRHKFDPQRAISQCPLDTDICELPLSFASNQIIVLEADKETPVMASCIPRKFLIFGFDLMAILLFLSCAFQ